MDRNEYQDRLNAIRQSSGQVTPTVGVKSEPKPQQSSFKSQFSNISDDDWKVMFSGDESGKLKTMYFNLMEGKDRDAFKAMKADPKQSIALNYWQKTYQQGKELATYFNTNRNAWSEENDKELNSMLIKFQQYHTLSQRAALETLGGDKNIDPSKAYDAKIKGSTERKDEYLNRYIFDKNNMQLRTYEDFQQDNQDIRRGESFYSNVKLKKGSGVTPGGGAAMGAGIGVMAGAGAAYGASALSWTGPGAVVGAVVGGIAGAITGYFAADDEDEERLVTKHEGYSTYMKSVYRQPPALKAKLNLVLGDWASESLKLNDPKAKGKFKNTSAYNQNILNSYSYVQDIIREGFKSKNQEVRDKTKLVFDQLAKYKGDWQGKVKLLQSSNFRHDVASLLQDKGYSYYSKVNLYNKHKNTFADPKYIDGDKLKDFSAQNNIDIETAKGMRAARLDREIGQYFELQKSRREIDNNIKTKYRNELSDADVPKIKFAWYEGGGEGFLDTKGFSAFFNKTMFDKGGNPIAFEKWYSQLPARGEQSPLYTSAVKEYQKQLEIASKKPREAFKGYSLEQDARNAVKKKYGNQGLEEINVYNSIYIGNYQTINGRKQIVRDAKVSRNQEAFRDIETAYNGYKDAYKSKWDNFESTQHYANSSMGAGLGALGKYELIDGHINLNRDVPKSQNANNLIDFVTKATEKPGSTIFVKSGKWEYNESIKDMEGEESVKSSTVANFFKNKDNTSYDLTYVNTIRDSGQALYMFTDRKSKKTLSIVMPKSLAKQAGEQFASHEYNDDDDFWFDVSGKQDLKYYGSENFNYSRESYIYTDAAGNKVLSARVKNPENPNEEEQKDILLGPSSYMTIDQAVSNAMTFLKQYENQFK